MDDPLITENDLDRKLCLPLARNLVVAWAAHKLGITTRSAEKYVSSDPAEIGPFWYELANFILKTQSEALANLLNIKKEPRPQGKPN